MVLGEISAPESANFDDRGKDCGVTKVNFETEQQILRDDEKSLVDFLRESPLFGVEDIEFIRDPKDFYSRSEKLPNDIT